MEPTTLLPAIALLSLVTVESGGWALLGFITARRGALDARSTRRSGPGTPTPACC